MINDHEFFLWASNEQKKLENELIQKISLEEAWKHVVWLTENGLPRMSGTPGERKAADYVQKTLEEYGLSVTISEFDAHVSIPGNGQLQVIVPEEREIACQAQAHSVCPSEGIEGELIYAGAGSRDDIAAIDVQGKIVLAEAREGVSIPEVARYAEDGEAIGLVLANWAEHFIFYSIKQVMGNPAPHQMAKMPHIPAVAIKVSDAQYLKSQLNAGKVRLWMKTDGDKTGWMKTVQPMAVMDTGNPDYALLGGHYDVWGGGVICNATGTAFMLELARVLVQHKKQFNRSLKIVFWSGHENGMCSGSIWYLDNMWAEAKKHLITTYTVDTPGHLDQPLHRSVSTQEIRQFHETCIQDTLPVDRLDSPLSYPDDAKVGDSMFYPWDLGSPAIWDGKRNSSTYPEWHSAEDTLDKARPEILHDCLKVYLVSIARLLNAPILPFNFVRLIDEYIRVLTEFQESGKDALNLQDILTETIELKNQITKFNQKINKIISDHERCDATSSIVNQCLIKLGRNLNPLFYSEAPFHDYDLYGSWYPKPIPILQPIKDLAKLDPKSDEFKILQTGLIRQRNRVLDGLQDARDLVQETQKKISR